MRTGHNLPVSDHYPSIHERDRQAKFGVYYEAEAKAKAKGKTKARKQK